MPYKHLFFDWDHTLWDFETNSDRALTALYYHFDLRQFGIQSPQHLIDVYKPINYKLWADFRDGKIDAQTVKVKRFQDTLKLFSVTDLDLASQIKTYYLNELPIGGTLMPNVVETLELLKPNYSLHIVTNGFYQVTQEKLKFSGISDYFDTVVTADDAQALKPDPKVFQMAFERAGAQASNSLFIGDNIIADVIGPRNVGMDQVFYNPNLESHEEQPTFEIQDLLELVGILDEVKLQRVQ